MPMLGTNAPVTLAGTVAQANAEMLGANTVLQTLFPGTPIIYYCLPMVTDMHSGAGLMSSPENILLYASITQMGTAFYHLPTETTAFLSDGTIPELITYQKGAGLLIACMSGINIIGSAGSLDSAIMASLAQLVVDDDIVRCTRRIVHNFDINDEKIGIEAIDRVGPAGNFLLDDHTLSNLRSGEISTLKIFTQRCNSGDKDISQNLYKKAYKNARNLLSTHEVPKLERHIGVELNRILKAADKELNL